MSNPDGVPDFYRAIHEASHGVASIRFFEGSAALSIIPDSTSGGREEPLYGPDERIAVENERYIVGLLAGYAAEVTFDPTCHERAWLTANTDRDMADSHMDKHDLGTVKQ